MYPDGGDLPEHGADCDSGQHPYAQDLRAHFETELFTEEQVRGLRRGYLGCVTYVDRQLGRLLDALREIGALDRTLVAYTSDHGDMLGKFGMWWKCTLFEDSVRVPTIVMGPGFAAGARVSTPVDAHDLRATMFAATGATQPEGWLGTPLQDVPAHDKERVVFSEYHGHGTRASAFMIRKGDWKLIWNAEAPHQLYNLANDPEELHNLHEGRPRVAANLEKELRAICSPELENQRAEEMIVRQIQAVGRMENIPPRKIP
jgi:choline-sulfatase